MTFRYQQQNYDKNHFIWIMSYNIIRTDIQRLKHIEWDYIILDEGHFISNPKSMLSIAIKQLISHHRLILSGTPIQNNVLELWNLFDFLMPGYLGTQKEFNSRYTKPIMKSMRDNKNNSDDSIKGYKALKELHRKYCHLFLEERNLMY